MTMPLYSYPLTALVVAVGMLHCTTAAPRRQLQGQGADVGCDDALARASRNATHIAACVDVCIRASEFKNGTSWNVESIGSAACTACAELLTRCPEVSTSGVKLPAVGFKSDVSASGMKCLAKAYWGSGAKQNATHPNPTTHKLRVTNVCFPSQCSYDDARATLEAVSVARIANFKVEAACDIFASFVDSSVTWFVLGGSVVVVLVVFILSRHSCCGKCGRPVKCVMWFFWLLDIAIGAGFLAFGAVLFNEKDFPSYLPVAVAGLGAVLLLMALLIYCGIRSHRCSCLLHCVVLVGGVLGAVCFALGIALQLLGDKAMETSVERAGLTLSASDREGLQDFMHVAQTLLVCVFYLVGAVQFSVLFLAPRVREAIEDYKEEQKQRDREFGTMDESRREKGGQAFQDKMRKQAEKQVAKEKKHSLKNMRP